MEVNKMTVHYTDKQTNAEKSFEKAVLVVEILGKKRIIDISLRTDSIIRDIIIDSLPEYKR